MNKLFVQVRAECGPTCAKRIGLITVTEVFLHMHGHGRKGVVRLVRDGKELRPIATIGACTHRYDDNRQACVRARACAFDVPMRIRVIDFQTMAIGLKRMLVHALRVMYITPSICFLHCIICRPLGSVLGNARCESQGTTNSRYIIAKSKLKQRSVCVHEYEYIRAFDPVHLVAVAGVTDGFNHLGLLLRQRFGRTAKIWLLCFCFHGPDVHHHPYRRLLLPR